jgi:hypothetical protein
MLTAQCDELRETAADLREHSTFVGFGGIFNINDEMVDAARQMEDAADTIMGLRDRLTVKESGTMSYASDALIDAQENTINQLKAQNEKLRELVRDMYGCGDSCTHCKHWNQGDGFYCDLGVGWKARRMRELGIEVE